MHHLWPTVHGPVRSSGQPYRAEAAPLQTGVGTAGWHPLCRLTGQGARGRRAGATPKQMGQRCACSHSQEPPLNKYSAQSTTAEAPNVREIKPSSDPPEKGGKR